MTEKGEPRIGLDCGVGRVNPAGVGGVDEDRKARPAPPCRQPWGGLGLVPRLAVIYGDVAPARPGEARPC